MIKMGDKEYEWVLLHFRNGEEIAGMIEVPADLKNDDPFYKRCLAAEIMQPKTEIELTPTEQHHGEEPKTVDRIIELRNPHRVITQVGDGKQIMAVLGLNLGDKIIYPRASEIMYPQFLDDKSPVVIEIRKSSAGLAAPLKDGETKTEGGIILPGAAAKP